jgi:hypothetical protein
MKKIISFGIFLLVLIAFSGVASASYVTDSGGKTTYYNNGLNKDIEKWSVTHYTTNHIIFKYSRNEMTKINNAWKSTFTVSYYRDYTKVAYNKIALKGYGVQQGKYYLDNKWSVKTTHSVYYYYKYIDKPLKFFLNGG